MSLGVNFSEEWELRNAMRAVADVCECDVRSMLLNPSLLDKRRDAWRRSSNKQKLNTQQEILNRIPHRQRPKCASQSAGKSIPRASKVDVALVSLIGTLSRNQTRTTLWAFEQNKCSKNTCRNKVITNNLSTCHTRMAFASAVRLGLAERAVE